MCYQVNYKFPRAVPKQEFTVVLLVLKNLLGNFPDGSVLKNPPCNERTWVQSLTRDLRTTCHGASKPAYTAMKDPSCYNRDPTQPNK